MSNTQENKGNPEIGMQADSIDDLANQQKTGSDEFFTQLENEVNGQIQDTEATQSQNSGTEQATHVNQDIGSNTVEQQSNNGVDWEKRYTDSSREAVKWRDQYKQVEQFVPVLDAMKNDSGLVEHVRSYLMNGGKPAKSIQEQLNLDEDFIFDQQEAMTNPESDSAKLMNAHVDTLVQKRVGNILSTEKQKAMQFQKARNKKAEEEAFIKKHNMSNEQFEEFKSKAKGHILSLDDINYLINRRKNDQNVANSTKADMLNQMKNVQSMPTSASGANSQNPIKNPDDDIFDGLLDMDTGVDNLFG